jgi:hypothetical protein
MTMAAHAESNIARDPKIAVQEEYDLAVSHGTVAALELFIARHPDSKPAARAAAQVRKMKQNKGEPK